ncbi:MAG TPA: hypothetical protein VHF50_07745 [Solirubrobacterales bacterium]|nr:hypothetical protein [Solirubrobacterales bacterium]
MRISTVEQLRGRRRVGAACGVIALVALLVVAAAAPAAPKRGAGKNEAAKKRAAASKAGRLDRAFGVRGKLVTVFPRHDADGEYANYRLPFEFAEGRIAIAQAGRGKLVAANGAAIVRYLRDGDRDPRFGGNGAVPIGPIEGSRFQLADVAVDSKGRVLVAGTTRPRTRFGQADLEVPGPIPSVATIRRYLSNGQPDPTFGTEGIVSTDLGAPRPTFNGSSYEEAAVGVVGLTVDAADRPIVTGSAVTEVGRCKVSQGRYEASTAIVARLAVNGAPDTSFDGDGVKLVAGLSWLGSPVLRAGGVLSGGTKVEPCPKGGPDNPSVLVSLAADGSPNAAFRGASWSRPFTRIADVATAPKGKVVLLVRTIELVRGKWVESRGEAVRLRANGSYDKGFGRGGILSDLRLPRRASIEAIASDRGGRVLLAGTVFPKAGKKAPRAKFLLMRTTKDGETDRSFGRSGRVTTGFGRRTNVQTTDVLVMPGNRILVGGKFSGPSTDTALALARYRGKR